MKLCLWANTSGHDLITVHTDRGQSKPGTHPHFSKQNETIHKTDQGKITDWKIYTEPYFEELFDNEIVVFAIDDLAKVCFISIAK